MTFILEYEKKFNIIGDKIIPDIYNLCAGFQLAVTKHLCQRTQRAMEFIEKNNLFPQQQRTLVRMYLHMHNTCYSIRFTFFTLYIV